MSLVSPNNTCTQSQVTASSYLSVEKELAATSTLSDTDIVHVIIREDEDEDQEMEDEVPEQEPLPSTSQCNMYFKRLRIISIILIKRPQLKVLMTFRD